MADGVIPDRDAFARTRAVVKLVESLPIGRSLSSIGGSAPSLQLRLVKTDAAIAADASGTCSVYWHATQGSETDTGDNLTGFTRTPIDDDKWCLAIGMPNGWELIPLEC